MRIFSTCLEFPSPAIAPTAVNQRLDTMTVRAAMLDATGQQVPHSRYGTAIQMNAQSASGTSQDWGQGVRVSGFETRSVKLADGTVVELRKPTLAFDGPVPGRAWPIVLRIASVDPDSSAFWTTS